MFSLHSPREHACIHPCTGKQINPLDLARLLWYSMLVMRGTVPFMMGCLNEGDDEMSTTTLPRFATDTNHKPARASKATKPKPLAKPRPIDDLTLWSHVGVITTALLSAVLNAYANYQTASVPAFGVILGVCIPWIVFVLCKVGGKQFRQGHRRRAYFTAFAAGCLLLLSIHHCTASIAMLTGMEASEWGPYLMAIAIDVGLVACEVATVKMK